MWAAGTLSCLDTAHDTQLTLAFDMPEEHKGGPPQPCAPPRGGGGGVQTYSASKRAVPSDLFLIHAFVTSMNMGILDRVNQSACCQ